MITAVTRDLIRHHGFFHYLLFCPCARGARS